MMLRSLRRFYEDQGGNAVVDWTVLMSGLVVLGLSVGYSVSGGAASVADELGTKVGAMEPTVLD